jgi:hypothetical protein
MLINIDELFLFFYFHKKLKNIFTY